MVKNEPDGQPVPLANMVVILAPGGGWRDAMIGGVLRAWDRGERKRKRRAMVFMLLN